MSSTAINEPIASASAPGGLWTRLTNGRTNYDFVRNWKKWAALSGTLIVVGLLTLGLRGFNLGIDFRGGTVWELKRGDMNTAQATSAFRSVSKDAPVVQLLGNDKIRVKGLKTEESERTKVAEALAKKAGIKASEVNVTFVGPSWGRDVSRKALQALGVFFIVISAFISLRFQWKMAVAALAAVVHDVLITVGFYALSGFEVTPATVIAFLTILGFSLYDTIVVFDKVTENEKSFGATGKLAYSDVVNLSMNQVMMRSLNTSLVAILPVVSMLIVGVGIMGATAIRDFALALFIGLITGAYSSIFVASPLLALLKERETSWKTVRSRIGAAGAAAMTPEAAARARAGAGIDAVLGRSSMADSFRYEGGGPRGRKPSKKR
jgi:preprotein translocase subunit SecF